MVRGSLAVIIAGTLFAGTATSANAYLAEETDFAARAGSAGSLTYQDAQLGPVEIAIRERLAHAGRDGEFHDKRDGAAVAEFYAERGFQPVWTADGKLTPAAIRVIARIGQAAMDGLDPAAYRTPGVGLGVERTAPPGRLARAEIQLSLAVERYAREAYAGRVDPSSISPNIDIRPHLPDPIEVLASVSSASDPAATLAAYNPPQPQYQALRAKLAELRSQAEAAPVVVPDGKTLRLGMTDDRVAVLRQRLKITDAAVDANLFDEAVDTAVKAFQTSHGLGSDGIVGPNTYRALNAQAGVSQVGEVIANMERWRWMPRDMTAFYVHVNVPEFMVRVNRDGETVHQTRVVVGKVSTPTPIFNDEMEHIIVNPYWNVPSSIAVNEMMPRLISNPASVSGYEVYARVGGRTRRVDPTQVDWSQVNPRSVSFRQPPGRGNALGNIKFMFPNSHDVYLHDTPSKGLFANAVRAYSHGCVRVQDPLDFAAALLQEDDSVSVDKIRKLIGGREIRENLERHIPVYITYFTAVVGPDGELRLMNDIYGYSAKVRKALGV